MIFYEILTRKTRNENKEQNVEITKLMAKNKDNVIDESAFEKIRGIYNDAVKISDFGNGRYVRNIIEKAVMNNGKRRLTLLI